MISYLTYDILETIFDHLDPTIHPHFPLYSYDLEQNDRRKSKLKSIAPLCLVSRSWVSPARRVLYRAIPNLSINGFEKFLGTFEETPDIRLFVRWMYVYSGQRETRLTIIEYLPRCLLIFVTGAGWHKSPAKNIIPHISTIGGILLDSSPWEEEGWMVAFRYWTNLQSLTLSNGSFQFRNPEFAEAAHREHVLPALQTLVLDDNYRHVLRGADLFTPPTTPNTLHTLSISRQTYTTDPNNTPKFLGLLVRHSESLRCLCLLSVQFSERVGPIFDDLGLMLPRLESLLVSGTRHVFAALFSKLPSSIVDITVGFNDFASEEPLENPTAACLALLRSESHSQLRFIGCQLSRVIGSQALEAYMREWEPVVTEAERSKVYLHCELYYSLPADEAQKPPPGYGRNGYIAKKTSARLPPLLLFHFLNIMLELNRE
jgi:hypothetical protein